MTIRLSKNGKRMGRPPKNAVITSGQTFVIDQKHEAPKFELSSEEMIECSLVPINEFSHIKSETQKVGRYAQSTYSLNKFGKSGFVVLAYIETDLEKYRNEGISDEQIVNRCVNYLNQETKKKKPYGNLQLYGYKLISKFGKEIVAIEMVTDMKSNSNFWGTGNR